MRGNNIVSTIKGKLLTDISAILKNRHTDIGAFIYEKTDNRGRKRKVEWGCMHI
ncbi:MAG: hypothetical protein HFG56_03945 [Lachnospiraceae bacterium]|jgi:hypothetical protein|nr:hypothetical protein [Lachnospiraceae bacterium]